MSETSSPKLLRALGLKDLVFLNISCIFGFASLAQVAQFGYASIPLYLLAIAMFLIPSGLMVTELNSRMPEEGGFYLWTRKAFGNFHGYIVAWSYWLSNIVWLPSITILITLSGLYIFGDNYLFLKEDPRFTGLLYVGILWFVTLVNIRGLKYAKWIQNISVLASSLTIILLIVFGILFILNFDSAQEFSPAKLLPDFSDFSVLPFFAIVAFAFGGLEMAPLMAGEIRNPKKNIPRAIVYASIAVGAIYILGTLMLIITVPEGEISVIEGMAQSFSSVSQALKTPWLGSVGAAMVALGTLGLFSAWLTGTARIPFVIGLDRYLPKVVGKVHPQWGSPYVSLLMQAIVLTLLYLVSTSGSTIVEAFLIMLDMSILLYFLPFLYMFAALVKHKKKNTGGEGVISIFQRSSGIVWIIAGMGFIITLFSMIMSTIPSGEIENKSLFVVKVIGSSTFLLGAGLVVYFLKKWSLSRKRTKT
jgi:amino acid transporter